MIVIVLAALGAGAINSLVGSGTLITFPTLIALGFPPVTATMSNAIGLVAGGVSGTWGYRAELAGQWRRLRWQIPASLIGAAIGAFLLLHLPERVFIQIVPVLLVLALLLVIGLALAAVVLVAMAVFGQGLDGMTSAVWAVAVILPAALGTVLGAMLAMRRR